jgi:hypothetical protein
MESQSMPQKQPPTRHSSEQGERHRTQAGTSLIPILKFVGF